jgi:hypothetical protein
MHHLMNQKVKAVCVFYSKRYCDGCALPIGPHPNPIGLPVRRITGKMLSANVPGKISGNQL